MVRIQVSQLRESAVSRLKRAGIGSEDAEVLVDHMLTADLWGRGSHGLSVRFPAILRQARLGNADRRPELVEETGGRVLVEGYNGFGYVGGRFCARTLIERCNRQGSACVALRNTRHTGMLGYYVDMAAREGVVALAFGNCSALMAPFGGKEALLGTNPIAFGFPAEPNPIVVDMATSALAYGEVMEREREGEPLPPDCALDKAGEPTREPAGAREGALLPFGGHRGGALAVAIQLIAGALTGSPALPEQGKGYGLFLQGYERGAFTGPKAYDRALEEFAEAYLAVEPREDSELRLPGSQRYENLRRSRERGVEVTRELLELLDL